VTAGVCNLQRIFCSTQNRCAIPCSPPIFVFGPRSHRLWVVGSCRCVFALFLLVGAVIRYGASFSSSSMSSFTVCHPVGVVTQRTTWAIMLLYFREAHTIRVIATARRRRSTVHRRSELPRRFEQRHVRHSRFPSVSSLPVVCVEVARAKLTSALLQVASAMHSAKMSLLDPHLATFLLVFCLSLPVCHGQNPSISFLSMMSRSENRSAWQSRCSPSCCHPPLSNVSLLPPM
jgi:hypothetical protein